MSQSVELKPLIRIVDDDLDQRIGIEMMLTAEGWECVSYGSAKDFLTGDTPSRPGCLILDVRMPDISGIEMQALLKQRQYSLPIIFLTGHGDVDMAVHVLKLGAKDFLQKPVEPARLLSAISTVVQEDLDQHSCPINESQWLELIESLTEREREIIIWVAQGKLNREIADLLKISDRTVHVHRQ